MATVGAALVLVACAYRGPAQTPVGTKLTWFSYAAAADVRVACTPDGPDAFRLIYNGDFEQQIRGYDIVFGPAGGASLTAQARGRRGDLSRLSLAAPLGPWAVVADRVALTAEQAGALRAAVTADGAFAGTSGGQRLPSDEYYWLAASCIGGQFYYAAYLHPQRDHARLRFPALLLELDRTGVPLRAARPLERRDGLFLLQVSRAGDGLIGPQLAL